MYNHCDRCFKNVRGGWIYGLYTGSNPGCGDCVVFFGRRLFYLCSVSSCWCGKLMQRTNISTGHK